jgi:hypothetical protein
MARTCASPAPGVRPVGSRVKRRHAVAVMAFALLTMLSATATSGASFDTSGALVAENCSPVGAGSDGTMVWYSKNASGVWDTYIGNSSCQGVPLLPRYEGNRGPADITPDGRYVLLTTAVGWDRKLPFSGPGRGSQNAIQLYDRRTSRLSTLLEGATSSQRGVIWPKLSPDGTKIAWSQMLTTSAEDPPQGAWAIHVADVNLETGTLSHNVEWQDPNGVAAFYEDYGWIPDTNKLIFMSTGRATSSGWGQAQLFTLPDDLNPSTAPTRISPPFPSAYSGQPPFDVYHEFAAFAPGDPNTLYTAIGADTVGGDDVFSYDMRKQAPDGLLGEAHRASYFGGDPYFNRGTQAIPGWPEPSYKVVTTMAWVNGWVTTACPDILCESVQAWRIGPKAAISTAPSQPATPWAGEVPAATQRTERTAPVSHRVRKAPNRRVSCAISAASRRRAAGDGSASRVRTVACRRAKHTGRAVHRARGRQTRRRLSARG